MSLPEPGQAFGPYLVERRAGQGGMGVVYRARDTRLDRAVALKVLHEEGGAGDERARRFSREARLAAALSHPNIATVYEVGEVGGVPYIAMEWIEGRPLRRVAADGGVSDAARVGLLLEIADALAHAHDARVVHRDLKPGNVLVDARGHAKLVDFGIAKRAPSPEEPAAPTFVTAEDAVLGTPAYMAPEQLASGAADARADQFAWGVVAYELLARRHPRGTTAAAAAPFPGSDAAPLARARADVAPAVAAVVERAMRRAPEERFASMHDVVTALRAAAPAVAVAGAGAGAGAGAAADAAADAGAGAGPLRVFAITFGGVLAAGAAVAIVALRAGGVAARGPDATAVTAPSPLASASAPASAPASASAVDAGAGRSRSRRARVRLFASIIDLSAPHPDYDAMVAPCFVGVTLERDHFVDGRLLVMPDGEVRSAEWHGGCVARGPCGPAPWAPPQVIACVQRTLGPGLRLPRRAEPSANPSGSWIGVDIQQE